MTTQPTIEYPVELPEYEEFIKKSRDNTNKPTTPEEVIEEMLRIS